MTEVVDDPEELTASWLSDVLVASGLRVTVTDVQLERVGTGQMGRTYRLHLGSRGREGPATLIAKLAGENEETRALVAPGYAAEVGFYASLLRMLDVRTPRPHYCAISEDHTRFTLLLEDVHPAAPGVQADGCTVDQARAALRNMVGLHAPSWSNPALFDLDFLMRSDPDTASMMAQVMSQATESFIERFAGRLAPEDGETLRDACGVIEQWQQRESMPFSVIHGDYRLDNLLFDEASGDVTVVDWQTAAIGPPLRDVAYFLGTSLHREDRRTHEEELVAAYHAEVADRGVGEYDFAQCWADYRLGQLQGPMITVIGCIYASGEPTPGADAMFLAMARRSCAAVRELGSLDLV